MLTLGAYDLERSMKLRNLRLSENFSLETVNALAVLTLRCSQFEENRVRFLFR